VGPRSTVVEAAVGGRTTGSVLPEPDAQRITPLLGIRTPEMIVAGTPVEAARAVLPGARVVVKVVGPAHKAAVGGVLVVDNDPASIAGAAEAVAAVPGATSVLVAEWIDHDPMDELIAGVRWTEAFGPVVSIGPGGVSVEHRAAPAIIAASLADRGRRIIDSHAALHDVPGLPELADRLLELGTDVMPRHLTEFEVNPVVITADGPVALDALAVAGTGEPPAERVRASAEAIDHQLRPASMAIVGVSDGPNPGRQILRNVIAAGFPADRITVVKPGAVTIEECRCVESVAALDHTADLLVVAITGDAVPDLMAEIVDRSAARSVVLISGGLGERPGTEAAALRIAREIDDARRAGRPAPAVTGPNSMGIRSVPGRYDATFIPDQRTTHADARRAGVAVVAQSGAFTLSRLDRLPWLQPDHVVSVGNQIDLTVGDYLDHFADDPGIRIVACYVEGFAPRDGDRVLRSARGLADRGGVVIWHRGGRTSAGAGAARSHTAAIATDDTVAAALARAAGIVETRSLEDWEGLLTLAVALDGRPVGRRVGVVSNAGFECVAAADALGDLRLAPLTDATMPRLADIAASHGLADLVTPANPLDLTPAADDAAFVAAVSSVLDDPSVDVAVIGCVPFTPSLRMADDAPPPDVSGLETLADHPTPWICVIDAGRRHDPFADRIQAAGIPVIRSIDRAVRLLDAYVAARLQALP